MNQSETVALLKKIYQNAKTGLDALAILMSRYENNETVSLLKAQQDKYYSVANEASMQLSGYRELPPEGGVFAKLGMWASLEMNIVNTRHADRMAETLINASMEGVIELTRMTHILKDANDYSKDLASRMILTEQENIKLMQQLL